MSDLLRPIGSGEEWTTEQCVYLLGLYEGALDKLGYQQVAFPDPGARATCSLLSATRFECLNHAYWLCSCVRRFMREGRVARAYRTMGMIQGLLFMGGVFSLEELAHQERHVPSTERPRRVRDVLGGSPASGQA